MPCPICQEPVNVFDAANIDIDAYDFGATKQEYRCPACGAELEQIVPFIAVGHCWHWQLKQACLQQQTQKAKAFDEQSKPSADTNPS